MKKLWIVGNWKSNKTISESLQWIETIGPQLQKSDSVSVAVCPNFVCLSEVKKAVQVGNYPLLVGAQNLSPFGPGAYTGEVTAEHLKGVIDLSILGHSERRKNFGETDQQIEDKIILANRQGILPLLCVQDQNTPIPNRITVVAYEPVFAIGTGTPDTPDNANEVARRIKEKHPTVEVLYGGSIKSDNAKAFLEKDYISGLLIGGASLDPEEFRKIIEIAHQVN